MKYNKSLKGHIALTLVLAITVVAGMFIAYRSANAAGFQSHIETIEIDIQEQTPVAQVEPTDDQDSTQFMYLAGLSALGLLGIGGVVRDMRRDNA